MFYTQYCFHSHIQQIANHQTLPSTKNELYLKVNSLLTGDFGFQYKHRVGDNYFLRISSLTSSRVAQFDEPVYPQYYSTKNTYFNSGLNIGLEKRKQYNSKISFFYGIDLIGQFDQKTSRTDNPTLPMDQQKVQNFGVSLGVGLGLGFLYKIKDNVHLGFEMTPNILVRYSEEVRYYDGTPVEVKSLTTRHNFNTNNLSLSIVYFLRKDE